MTRKRVCCSYGAFLLLGAGCVGGRSDFGLGQEAERQGEVHTAYEYYCKAAASRPDDPRVASAITRVAPTAATFWHSQAQIARSEQRYEDAYLHTMHCLAIRPNHQGALRLAAQLEQDQPDAVASAKGRWLRGGAKSLALAKQDDTELVHAGPTEGRSPPPAAAQPRRPARESTSGSEISAAGTTRKQERPGVAAAEKREAPPAPPEPASAKSAASSRRVAAPAPDVMHKRGEREMISAPEADRSEYLVHCTLSKKDELYTRAARIMDGMTIRLRDTDDEGTADFDMFQGERRVQKIRELKTGRSKSFRGRSGRWYKLTLLGIHHKSRTATIGIRPA